MPDVAALVHVHPQAIAWQSEDPNKLQVVTNTSRGLVPGGYCVSPAHFRDLQHDPAKVTQLPTAARISLKMPPVVRIDSAALGHWRAVFTEPGQVGISKTLDSWRLARELAAAVVSRQRTNCRCWCANASIGRPPRDAMTSRGPSTVSSASGST